jgi:four helix bundle protein
MKFEDMKIWKDALNLSLDIYKIFDDIKGKHYSLADHIRKTSVSVPSNIAEGLERDNDNELKYHLRISKGSLGELYTQLYLAKELGIIKPSKLDKIFGDIKNLEKQIGGFIKYVSK